MIKKLIIIILNKVIYKSINLLQEKEILYCIV